MACKKNHTSIDKAEAIEDLICSVTRVVYTGRQCDWNGEYSLIETKLLTDLRECLREMKKHLDK